MSDAARVALGTVQWGMPYGIANRAGQPDRQRVAAILRLAREAGVRTLDTARAYGDSEGVIGALAGDDAHWQIITKIAPELAPDDDAQQAARAVEQSLICSREQLGRQRLDGVLLHRAEHRLAWGGAAWDVLRRQRDAKQIGAIGVSAGSPEQALEALDDPDVDALQVASSLLDQRLLRRGFFQRAQQLGRQVYVRSVFLQGVAFIDPAQLPGFLAAARAPLLAIERWAHEQGCTVGDAFLLFARQRLPGVLVLGCEAPEQLAPHLNLWQRQDVDCAGLERLADALPDLGAGVLDPAQWPPRED